MQHVQPVSQCLDPQGNVDNADAGGVSGAAGTDAENGINTSIDDHVFLSVLPVYRPHLMKTVAAGPSNRKLQKKDIIVAIHSLLGTDGDSGQRLVSVRPFLGSTLKQPLSATYVLKDLQNANMFDQLLVWRRPIAKLMPVLFNTRLAEPEPGGIGVNCIGNVLRQLFFHKPTAMAEIIETGALATLHELEKRNIVSCTQAQTQQMQDYSDTSDTDAEAVHGQPDVRLGKELGVDHADGGASVFISNPGHTSHTNDFSEWDMDIDVNFDVPMQQADLDVDIGVCNEQLSKEMMPCTKKRKKTKSTINADIDVGTCWENWQISADGMRQIEFARPVDMPQKVSVGRFSLPLAPAVFSVATTYEFILHLESEGWTWQKLKPFKGQSRPAYRIGDAASPKTWMTAGISVSTEYLHCLSEAQQLKNKFGIDAIPHGLPAKQYEQALKGIHFDKSLRSAHVRLGMKAHRRRSGRG